LFFYSRDIFRYRNGMPFLSQQFVSRLAEETAIGIIDKDECAISLQARDSLHLVFEYRPVAFFGFFTGLVLILTWFRNEGSTALFYEVSANGDWYNAREVYNWATQATRRGKLSDTNLSNLRTLLPKLPKSAAKPPIERTVVISFEREGKWCKEVYDSSSLPETFEKGARL
jgi:hypothetical protein